MDLNKSRNNQYSECESKLLRNLRDCIKFGHGEVLVRVRVTGSNSREVHVLYGRDYKYLVSRDEIIEIIDGSRPGSVE